MYGCMYQYGFCFVLRARTRNSVQTTIHFFLLLSLHQVSYPAASDQERSLRAADSGCPGFRTNVLSWLNRRMWTLESFT